MRDGVIGEGEIIVGPGASRPDDDAGALLRRLDLAAAAAMSTLSGMQDGWLATEDAAHSLIGNLLEFQDVTKLITDMVRAGLEEIVLDQPDMKIETGAGAAQITAPSISATYDARKLDQRAAGDEEFAALVRPYRRETHRSGSLRVSRAKAVTR